MKRIRKFLIVVLCFLASSALIGCTNEENAQKTQGTEREAHTKVENMDQSIIELKDQIQSLETQTTSMHEQKQYLVSVIQQILEDFSDEEMRQFSQNQFIYELKVNREVIPKNGKMIIPSGDVEVLLSEKGMGYDFLPNEWLEKGKISGNHIDHIVNFDPTNWEPVGMDGTVVTAQGCQLPPLR